MRFSLIALPALAATVSAAAISSDAVTTEAPAPTDGPYTYSNTDAALTSAVSEWEAKSPAAAATTTPGPSTVQVTGAPIVTESPKPASKKAATTKKVVTTKKNKKPKTSTTTTTTTKKKAAATKKNGKPKATPVKKKANAKRQNIADCAAMPKFYNYSPSQAYNTTKEILTSYMADSTFTAASLAGASPNSRYRWVWQGLYASAGAPYFVGGQSLPSYNVSACAAICDSSPGCRSFNIYYERTPSVAPAASCVNPVAITAIKCAMWDYLLTPAWATNFGQWQNEFAAVITGSNAYTKG